MAETSLIKKRRRLSALYDKGTEVRVGGRYGSKGHVARLTTDEEPEDTPDYLRSAAGHFLEPIDESDESTEISMWIQPPSPLNREEALRLANAARARANLLAKTDEDSEEYLSAMEFLSTMSDETLYEYVLLSETEDRRQDALREVLADEEWADITDLQESMRVFAEEEETYGEDHPEVVAVRERELELSRQVAERELELRDAAYEALKLGGPERARKQALEKRSEIGASQAFMREYERQMQYFAVRDSEEHARTYFFESPADLADQAQEIRDLVMRALSMFITDGAEAKN